MVITIWRNWIIECSTIVNDTERSINMSKFWTNKGCDLTTGIIPTQAQKFRKKQKFTVPFGTDRFIGAGFVLLFPFHMLVLRIVSK